MSTGVYLLITSLLEFRGLYVKSMHVLEVLVMYYTRARKCFIFSYCSLPLRNIHIISPVNGGVLVENGPECPEPEGEQAYYHPESCNLFFLCTNGTLTVEQCENGLLFDGKGSVYNHCNYNWAADCAERKADFTAVSTPGCEYQFGIYPETEDCSTNYIKCAHGEPLANECPPGLVYDHRIHGCNWPDLLQEICNPEAVVGFKCPTKVSPHSQAAKFWPYPRFAVPGDCYRFITCVHGFPRLITCDEGKVFDESKLACEEPELVPHCGGNHFKK